MLTKIHLMLLHFEHTKEYVSYFSPTIQSVTENYKHCITLLEDCSEMETSVIALTD